MVMDLKIRPANIRSVRVGEPEVTGGTELTNKLKLITNDSKKNPLQLIANDSKKSPRDPILKSSFCLLSELKSDAVMAAPQDVVARINSDANSRIKGAIFNYITLIKQGKDHYISNGDNEKFEKLSGVENEFFKLVKKHRLDDKSPFGTYKSDEFDQIKQSLQNALPSDFLKLGDNFLKEKVEPLIYELTAKHPELEVIVRNEKEIIDNSRKSNQSIFMESIDPIANRMDDFTTVAKLLDLVQVKLNESKVESSVDDKSNGNQRADDCKPNPQSAESRGGHYHGGVNNSYNKTTTINFGDVIKIINIHANHESHMNASAPLNIEGRGSFYQPFETGFPIINHRLADVAMSDSRFKSTSANVDGSGLVDEDNSENQAFLDANHTVSDIPCEDGKQPSTDDISEVDGHASPNSSDTLKSDTLKKADAQQSIGKTSKVDSDYGVGTPVKKPWPPVRTDSAVVTSPGSYRSQSGPNVPRHSLPNSSDTLNSDTLKKADAQQSIGKTSEEDSDYGVGTPVKKPWPPVRTDSAVVTSPGSSRSQSGPNVPRHSLPNSSDTLNSDTLKKADAQQSIGKTSEEDSDYGVGTPVKKPWPPVRTDSAVVTSPGSYRSQSGPNVPRHSLPNSSDTLNSDTLKKADAQQSIGKTSGVDSDYGVGTPVKKPWPPVRTDSAVVTSPGSYRSQSGMNAPRNPFSNGTK